MRGGGREREKGGERGREGGRERERERVEEGNKIQGGGSRTVEV